MGIASSCYLFINPDNDDNSEESDLSDRNGQTPQERPTLTLSSTEHMQCFVEDISSYARKLKPGFIIIPQNAEELAFNEARQRNGLRTSYLNAVDGFGIEELFYDDQGRELNDRSRVSMLETLRDTGKKIMVSDYVKTDENYSRSLEYNYIRNFIAFPRSSSNYNYNNIPVMDDWLKETIGINTSNINALSGAKNYLYLIGGTGSNLLDRIADTNFDVVLIDLFFRGNNQPLTRTDLDKIKLKKNGGRRLVISYISIGSAENYRYYWKSGWEKGNPSWLVKSYSGYPNEYWVRFWDHEWQDIIYGNDKSYMKRIIDAGFDGAYLDNIEAYQQVRN